ncbi:hypothetical protein O9K51_06929 [Purpureocillium lavendulum]|uniref:Uncharacterized protein n=1 Tax=Purpureocillium lavendulum TaxID=1247861 RepID=A0AB34FPW1_9HYPO|nr:hypothetical protein O9K51_06929 [Purpureocillium lavendulum]
MKLNKSLALVGLAGEVFGFTTTTNDTAGSVSNRKSVHVLEPRLDGRKDTDWGTFKGKPKVVCGKYMPSNKESWDDGMYHNIRHFDQKKKPPEKQTLGPGPNTCSERIGCYNGFGSKTTKSLKSWGDVADGLWALSRGAAAATCPEELYETYSWQIYHPHDEWSIIASKREGEKC